MVLHIDIETRSRADLKKVGAHRYARDSSTRILCLAVAEGDKEPLVWVPDTGTGLYAAESIKAETLLAKLSDPSSVVYSHNAGFEISVLDQLFKKTTGFDPPAHSQWRCTAAMGRRAALPASLEKLAETLKLTNLKDSKGKSLIRKFSVPQSAGKLKGEFINPEDDLEAFKDFCEYCRVDVKVEQEIHRTLKDFELTGLPLQTFLLDLDINCRGFPVNLDALRKAEKLVNEETERLAAQFRELTGLEHTQRDKVVKWLVAHGFKHDNLRAETLDEVFEDEEFDESTLLGRVLSIKKRVSFASLKKIPAMINCAGPQDNRVRGTLTYHGAGTGRWSAQLVQPQNFKRPAEYLKKLTGKAYADITEGCRKEWLDLVYGPPLEVVSSCIRHFIQDKGPMLDADYAAIEARIIAWQAQEKWRLDVFKTHGKIYEASASMMFKVPFAEFEAYEARGEKHPLRQKGKVAELACIAEGQLVTTDHGLVPIEKVLPCMRVFDGKEFVKHGGVVYQGIKEVITYEGLTATKDHIVFTQRGEGEFFGASTRKEHLVQSRPSRHSVRFCEDHLSSEKIHRRELERTIRPRSMHKLRETVMGVPWQLAERSEQGLLPMQSTEACSALVRQASDGDAVQMHQPQGQRLPQLRRSWGQVQISLSARRLLVDNEQLGSTQIIGVGPNEQQRALPSRQSQVCDTEWSEPEQTRFQDNLRDGGVGLEQKPIHAAYHATHDALGVEQAEDHSFRQESRPGDTQKLEEHLPAVKTARVYDILNCGPRNRFVVSGVLVHNCGFGGGVAALERMGALKMGLTKEELPDVIKQWREANPAVVTHWRTTEDAAKNAIRSPGKVFPFGVGCSFFRTKTAGMSYLFMRLPSGRKLAYPQPELTPQLTWKEEKFGLVTQLDEEGNEVQVKKVISSEAKKMINPTNEQIARIKQKYPKARMSEAITFFGQIPMKVIWGRMSTYGGSLVENATQAIAADFMACGAINAAAYGYKIVALIHDEALSEYAPEKGQSVEEFVRLLTKLPTWAEGMPLAAEGGVVEFYLK